MEITELRCKFCKSPRVIRYGHYRKMQRWWCKDCQRKFADNNALPEMRTPSDQVASALSMFYEGMSLNAIRRHLNQMHENYPSDSTVYEWITRFSEQAIKNAVTNKPKVGDVWVADETMLEIDGQNVWFWDLIDSDTRFLLASHISKTRTIPDAHMLMKKAEIKAGKKPKVILTDKLAAYFEGTERAWGGDTKHYASKGFGSDTNTNLIERFHGTLKQRTKVMRGLKDTKTARLIMNGWLVHYNYFRPHEGIDNFTPAQKAGIISKQRNWVDVVNHSYVPQKPPEKIQTAERPKVTIQLVPEKQPRFTPRTPRLTPRMPRITPRQPRISQKWVSLGGGVVMNTRTGRRHLRLR